MNKKLNKYYFIITEGEYENHYLEVLSVDETIADTFVSDFLKIEYEYVKRKPTSDYIGTLIQIKTNFYNKNIKPKYNL